MLYMYRRRGTLNKSLNVCNMNSPASQQHLWASSSVFCTSTVSGYISKDIVSVYLILLEGHSDNRGNRSAYVSELFE